MEFHVSKKARDKYEFEQSLFSLRGPALFANLAAAREFTRKLQSSHPRIRYQDVYAMGLIDEIMHYVIRRYSEEAYAGYSERMFEAVSSSVGAEKVQKTVKSFVDHFPPSPVYQKQASAEAWLEAKHENVSGWAVEFEEMIVLWVENQNPAYGVAHELFDDAPLAKTSAYKDTIAAARELGAALPVFGPENLPIIDMLRAPALAHPDSLELQLEYIRVKWGYLLGDLLNRLLRGIDFLKEANAFFLKGGMGAGGLGKDSYVLEYTGNEEYERFSPDRDWMPRVVLLAKSTYVWLDQLSKKYGNQIYRLDQIPDEELDLIAQRGFNALWLIGLWERSDASRKIKNRMGKTEAVASAYSLYDYQIANEFGGWPALENLRWRSWNRGVRLASDMVPNHTGIESKWVEQHPDWFIQLRYPPFPGYTFNSESLSSNPDIGLYLEDHYYNQSDASVVFKRVDHRSGDTRYIYHGNDGTHMPWNDTAQLDYAKKEVREAVIQTILHVARNFPIIRFDAAMTLAKKHIQRLWFPEPGHGGDIPSRAEHGMTAAEFNAAIPQEFWREVVDRCAIEAPDTLLLAEAFWMMEGYFVRTLGMHRVYNSAFMNMLKMEDNAKYRQTIKNTISFDKDILKRFVNFMNNPDEETAVVQFGNGDKYFGVATLMSTMPGLPMFGHGQVEGYSEKYGMEFRRAYKDEQINQELVERHYQEIFPLLKRRYLFAEVENFYLYDLYREDGTVNENVFAYSNSYGPERALVFYNNSYESTWGTIRMSAGYVQKGTGGDRTILQRNLADALSLRNDGNAYCLLREQRSNQWFIRRSSDIHRDGLRVVLQGYQTQVYLDIHEVADNSYHHYRQLHDYLGGRGVPDVQEAIRDLVLGPIYQAFAQAIPEELWDKLPQLFDRKEVGGSEVQRGLREGYQRFIQATESFAPSHDKHWAALMEFNQRLDRLTKLLDLVVGMNAGRGVSKPRSAASFVLSGLGSTEQIRHLCAVLLLLPLSEANEEWSLQHKVPGLGDFRHSTAALLNSLKTIVRWRKAAPAPADLVEALGYIEVQEFILVNYYGGVRWYNKERFDQLTWWAMLWDALESSDLDEELLLKLYERAGKWLESHSKSDFKLDELKAPFVKKAPALRKPAKGTSKTSDASDQTDS